jgi:hypothetical protein
LLRAKPLGICDTASIVHTSEISRLSSQAALARRLLSDAFRRDPLLASVTGLNQMSLLTAATACRAQQLISVLLSKPCAPNYRTRKQAVMRTVPRTQWPD